MNDWKLWLSLGCFVLGILIALQFKQQEKEGFPLASYRPPDLLHVIKDSEYNRKQLQAQVENLRNRVAEYEVIKTGKGNVSHVLTRELQHARLEAGLLPVKGPGIELVLEDSKRRPGPGEEDYFYLVHDIDLNQLMNELWSSGAEAIAVNEQRIVANSAIRCVGPTILINTRRLSPPYDVKAIGDPDTLMGGLKMRGGFLDAMAVSRAHGVGTVMSKKENLQLPAFNGPTVFHYAEPAR